MVTNRLRPEELARFMAAARDFVATARGGAGCLAYDIHQSVTDPDLVTTIERWADPMSAVNHMAAPHTRLFGALVAECETGTGTFLTVPIPG